LHYRLPRSGHPTVSSSGCAIEFEICSVDGVKLALHNAYFFRAAATPSNLIRQSVLNRPCAQICADDPTMRLEYRIMIEDDRERE
jgi:hypothetical protein